MGSRYDVEVTVTSAKDLKNVNWRHGKLKPYAVVWVDPKNKCSSHVDDEGDTSPYWNEKLIIPFNSPIEDSTLYIDIVHAGADDDTKPLIGSAKLLLREVVDDVGLGSPAEKKLELKRPSGRPHGKLEVNVSVREPRHRAPDPYYAPPYGVPPQGSRDYQAPPYENPYGATPAYAAPPAGYPSYGAPPSYGQPSYDQGNYYGQQQPQGYVGQQQGYEEEKEEKKKKNNFGGMGMGLAVGAVGGVLGGIALAEGFDALQDKLADDAAERVEEDLGYDPAEREEEDSGYDQAEREEEDTGYDGDDY